MQQELLILDPSASSIALQRSSPKVLANRLAPRLNSLVSNCHSAFIKKRSIHDNFLYVQGAVQRLHTQKIPALFMKLDIHKLLIRFIGGTCSRFYRLWASDTDGVNGSLSFYVHPLPHPCLMGGTAPLLAMPEAFGKEIHSHPCYSSLLWTRFNVCLTGQPTMGYSPLTNHGCKMENLHVCG